MVISCQNYILRLQLIRCSFNITHLSLSFPWYFKWILDDLKTTKMALWMPNTIGFGVLSLSNVTDVSGAVSDLRATADNLHFSLFLAQSCCMEIDYIYGAFFIFVSQSPFTFIIWLTGVFFKPFCFPAGLEWREGK